MNGNLNALNTVRGLPPGSQLGKYEVRSKLGAGGMGEVYLALDTKLDRQVALKILGPEVAANSDRMRRFVQEAKAAAALNHPNIAHVYEIGEYDGLHFIAMEFIDGLTLTRIIHHESNDLPKLLRLLQRVAEGLAKAHAAGIVHRDLKPDNIMVTRDGYPKILDFGLAKLVDSPLSAAQSRNPQTDSTVPATGGSEKRLTAQTWYRTGSISWLGDGSGLIISAVAQSYGVHQLWYLSYPGGEVHQITHDFNDYAIVSLTSDSRSLVTVQLEQSSTIWTVPVNDGNSPGANLLVDTTKARQILTGSSTFDGRYGLAWMPDHRLTYTSAVAGTFDIWVMQADGSEQRQLTSDAGGSIYQTDNYEAASSDGRYIVFTSDRSTGNPHVWRMRSDGSDLKQMTNGPGEGVPRITPDGHTIVYFDFTTELLWKMPIDGGQPTQITNKRSDRPYISPDGKFIACGYETENNTPMKIAIIGIDGGPPVKIFNVPATVVVDDLAWTPDGRAITYVYTTNGVSNLWVQRLDGTTARQLTDFTSDRISSFDFSPDGKTLALARGNSRTDIVLFNRID